MTNPGGLLEPGIYKSITVETQDSVLSFTGAPELNILAVTNTYFITIQDASEASGKRVVWQQRVDSGYAEGVKITAERL